jgi:transketolase
VGDQIGVAVSGTLYYVPFKEFERIRALPVSAVERTALFAALCRINTLYMIARAGSGHIGSSFSSMDIMSWLQLNELRTPPEGDTTSPRDIFFSSKGHDAPGLYNTFTNCAASAGCPVTPIYPHPILSPIPDRLAWEYPRPRA